MKYRIGKTEVVNTALSTHRCATRPMPAIFNDRSNSISLDAYHGMAVRRRPVEVAKQR